MLDTFIIQKFLILLLEVAEFAEIEEIVDFIEENAPVITPIAVLTAFTPPPLPMFPPLGVPQPATTLSGGSGGGGITGGSSVSGGGTATGGGFTPAAALGVRIFSHRINFDYMFKILNSNFPIKFDFSESFCVCRCFGTDSRY